MRRTWIVVALAIAAVVVGVLVAAPVLARTGGPGPATQATVQARREDQAGRTAWAPAWGWAPGWGAAWASARPPGRPGAAGASPRRRSAP